MWHLHLHSLAMQHMLGYITLHNQGWPKIHLSCFSNQSH
uniref:Uncharacterized protein n=1 Tax=Picea sitchensis TaxID=3332 RepID=D5AA52_PICSI|nr:unknown [Picea sitchensis]